MTEVNLDENLKRKTLNPTEEARGYANFRDRFDRSEQWIAGKFTFPQPIQDLVAKGLLTSSHSEPMIGCW
jgi:hypothetical protein